MFVLAEASISGVLFLAIAAVVVWGRRFIKEVHPQHKQHARDIYGDDHTDGLLARINELEKQQDNNTEDIRFVKDGGGKVEVHSHGKGNMEERSG